MLPGFGRKKPESDENTPAGRMITLENADVYYLPITKCGSTFMLNLFYYLDHGVEHETGNRIHQIRDQFPRAGAADDDKIRASKHAFTVLRHPVDRFLSLYFDKIYGDGPQNFGNIRHRLVDDIGLDLTRGLNAAGHRENCLKFIDWLADNLAHKTDMPVNPHWRPQSKRLKRFAALGLEALTLDGLNWQLPMLLGDAVPDIESAMAAVRSDNRIARPFTNQQILDDGLQSKILRVYAADMRQYEAARLKWNRRKPQTGGEVLTVISAGDIPFHYVPTLKVGCTYLRNLFFYLEHGKMFAEPLKIHANGVNTRKHMTRDQLSGTVGFFVVRDPVKRFFSLYFDKAYGTGSQSFPWIAERINNKRLFDTGTDISLEQHRENCLGFLGYLRFRFKTQSRSAMNAHWRPQMATADRAIPFGLMPLMMEDLDNQLLQVAGDWVEGLEAAMQAVQQRNATPKPFSAAQILTPEIEKRIYDLYAEDFALYERVKRGWAEDGKPPIL